MELLSPFDVPLRRYGVVRPNSIRYSASKFASFEMLDAADVPTSDAAVAVRVRGELHDSISQAFWLLVGECTNKIVVRGQGGGGGSISDATSEVSSSITIVGSSAPPSQQAGSISITGRSSGAPGSSVSSSSQEGHHFTGNDNRMYADPDAALEADRAARDGAPSCVIAVFQSGHEISRSRDVASFEPVVNLSMPVNPSRSVEVVVFLGQRHFEACFEPSDIDGEASIALRQTRPELHGAWSAAVLRVRVAQDDAFTATLTVIGAANLPRHGLSARVHRHVAGVFALIMQLSAEAQASSLALTADFSAQELKLEEWKHRALNPTWEEFFSNRHAVVEIKVEAAMFLHPAALDLGVFNSECSRSSSSDTGSSSGADCSRSTSSDSGHTSSNGCSRSTSSDSGRSSSSGSCSRSTSSGSGRSSSSGDCSKSTSSSSGASSLG